MRIEVVAEKLKETHKATGQHYTLAKGDVVTVPDDFGRHLCDRGWVKDLDGNYESAPLTPGVARLDVQTLNIKPGGM